MKSKSPRKKSRSGANRDDANPVFEALLSVQFVQKNGRRFAVLDVDAWESLMEWLELLEDTQIARQAFRELDKSRGNRARIGWQPWSKAAKEFA